MTIVEIGGRRVVPVHSSYTIQWGSTGRSLLVRAADADGAAVVGLGPASPGARAAYVREGEQAVELALDSFTEVDAALMPGIYRMQLPPEVVAPGSPHAMVIVAFDGAEIPPIDLELVAYDPLDEACIGMVQLQDKRRHEFLRTALPNLTKMEYEAGLDQQKRLADFLAQQSEG